MADKIDCVVIGAGVIGLAVARELALAGREVVILEAEAAIGTHTSSRNSEVIHAGIYYTTGSLKAQLCVAGRKALYRYCASAGVAHKRVGKLVVATTEKELEGLAHYKEQAEINGVDDIRMVSREEIAELEPEVTAIRGFLSPSTGIIDSHGLMVSYLGDAENHGATLVLNSPVIGGAVEDGGILLDVGGTEPTSVLCDTVINAAGLGAPALARSIKGIPPNLIPASYYSIGHYYAYTGRSPFKRLVYPVAGRDWLGIHSAMDLGDNLRFGPDAEWRATLDYSFDDSRRDTFYTSIRHFFPGLKDGMLKPDYTGIRPKIYGPGEPIADFVIQGVKDHGVKGLVNLFGIESPGLTSSLAVAAYTSAALESREPLAPRGLD